jgi:hypothetical protein
LNWVKLLENNPQIGVEILSHCYKIRLSIASKGKGKRGGARVITYVYISGKKVFLLSIYDKSEKNDISDMELKDLISSLDLE